MLQTGWFTAAGWTWQVLMAAADHYSLMHPRTSKSNWLGACPLGLIPCRVIISMDSCMVGSFGSDEDKGMVHILVDDNRTKLGGKHN